MTLTNSETIGGGNGGLGGGGFGPLAGSGGAGVQNTTGGTIKSLTNNAGASIHGGISGGTPLSPGGTAGPACRTPARSRR
jgi:hypothetical protein